LHDRDEFVLVADALAGAATDVTFMLYTGREAARFERFMQAAPVLMARAGKVMALSTAGAVAQSHGASLATQTVVARALNSRADDSLFSSMGRVAAVKALEALQGQNVAAGAMGAAAWSISLADRTKSGQLCSEFCAMQPVAARWQAGYVSGWVAPYGA
jgi:hypothetical protein